MLFSLLLSSCAVPIPEPLPMEVGKPIGDGSVSEESLQPTRGVPSESGLPSKPILSEKSTSEPDGGIGMAGTLPPEPTAEMFHFEGLNTALFEGSYAAYFAQEYVTSFDDFPRIVIPHVNVLGSYEHDGVLYYVCDIMYKIHYYDTDSGTFEPTVGSLGIPWLHRTHRQGR